MLGKHLLLISSSMTSSKVTLPILPKVAFSDRRNERLEWTVEHHSKLSTSKDIRVSAQITYFRSGRRRWTLLDLAVLDGASHVDVRLMQCHSLSSTLCRQFLVLVEGLSSQHLRPACITVPPL